ncbi:MAG: OsmC family protein [Ginsengibacter sp.]
MNKIELEIKSGSSGFEIKDESGHILHTDTSIENGGSNYGFRPMQLLLCALGSCSGQDVASILKKQRQSVQHFKIKIEGEREAGPIPSLWKLINLTFELQGNVEKVKAEKAVSLSIEKYCSVAETLKRGGTKITWKVNVINTAEPLPLQ